MESKITLADDVLAWTFGKPSAANIVLNPRNSNAAVATQMRIYRDRMKIARRFYLDDDFVATALELSRDLDKLEHWVNLARLPYENIWIEFSARAKVMASWEQGHFRENINDIQPSVVKPNLEDVPEKMGYLMHQTNEQTGFWLADGFAPAVKRGKLLTGRITPIPITWGLSPEGDNTLGAKRQVAPGYFLAEPRNSENYSETLKNVAAAAYGISAIDAESGTPAALLWAAERICVCIEPTHSMSLVDFQRVYGDNQRNLDHAHEFFRQHLMYVLKEDRGIMRFLITVLALMNNAPNIKRVPVANAGHRMTRGRNLEYLGHSIVTLELPKRKTISVLAKALDSASKERRRNRGHEVRGHFRQIERGKGPLAYRCEHVPTLVENGIGICVQCERLIRWIPSFARGDAELGWVLHEYNVITRDSANTRERGRGRSTHGREGDVQSPGNQELKDSK